MEQLMTQEEVCKVLQITRSKLYRLRKNNRITFYQDGAKGQGRVLFKRADINKYLKTIKK